MHVSSEVAVADWSDCCPVGVALLNQIVCQIPQYWHLCHHVWTYCSYISESDLPLHTAVEHICSHFLHDLLRTTISG